MGIMSAAKHENYASVSYLQHTIMSSDRLKASLTVTKGAFAMVVFGNIASCSYGSY